jgi:hypothetical protein
MNLESYTCDMCIWQHEETNHHLFVQCNFAKANHATKHKIYILPR